MELKCQTYNLPRPDPKPDPKPDPRPDPLIIRVLQPHPVDRLNNSVYQSNTVMNQGFYRADALVNGHQYRIYLYCSQPGQRQCRVVNIRFLGQQSGQPRPLPLTRLEYLGLSRSVISNYLN